jgi:hypothetical protein
LPAASAAERRFLATAYSRLFRRRFLRFPSLRTLSFRGAFRPCRWLLCWKCLTGFGVRAPLLPLVLCFVLSLYFFAASLLHISFVSHSSESPLVNLSRLRLLEAVPDIDCDSPLLLISRTTSSLVRYRCPTSLLFGSLTQYPFLPWPDYTEGHSADLGRALGVGETWGR